MSIGDADSSDYFHLQLPVSFPSSHYTPHGYIDNPYHSMVLNRSGVIRSFPPMGFGFWYTDFKGSYGGIGGHINYLSLLNFSICIDGKNFITTKDFNKSGSELYSAYHTKHVISYDWSHMDCSFSIKYFLPQEHSLAAVVEIENSGETPKKIDVYAIQTNKIGNSKWWGGDGFSASYDSIVDCSISKIWSGGDVFAMGSTLRSVSHTFTDSEQQQQQWMLDGGNSSTDKYYVNGTVPIRNVHRYSIALQPHAKQSFLVCLIRSKNETWAKRELQTALKESRPALVHQLQQDDTFWKQSPVLEGDWKEQWKHGWVYDFETLRMNVREPIGIFKHPWDAMQVHSPRLVLGETSFDMMALSYVDPDLAKEVIYGTFADALAPNIPCVREDGSMNMISSDGSECGTAPMWGYPFQMIKNIYLATGDKQWIEKLYPFLQAYIEWWLKYRTDSEGWLHCNNSWESGQDGARRFLIAEKNEAAVVSFVRTVDVEASMAEAMLVMKYFSVMLNKKEDEQNWERLSQQRIKNTRSMLVDNWYRDVDARTKKPIILDNHYDVTMLSPLTCGIASVEQVRAVSPMLQKFEKGLEWSPGLFTFVEAAWFAQHRKLAAEVVTRIADRVYKRIDSRSVSFYDSEFSYRIPGVANEYWPEKEIPAGGENYGWGATLPMNIIRNIIGFREKESNNGIEFYLAPTLPKELMQQGKLYTIKNLKYRNIRFDVTYAVKKSRTLSVIVKVNSEVPVKASVRTETGNVIVVQKNKTTSSSFSYTGENESIYIVNFE
jgi:hypothetical protein